MAQTDEHYIVRCSPTRPPADYGTLDQNDKHVQQTTPDNGGHVVYKIRWYVVTMVSLTSMLNNFLWATWGPISQSAELVYGWTDSTLFWVVNVGNITGCLTVFLGCYLVDVKGLRPTIIISTGAMLLSAAMRIITVDKSLAIILITVGQGINGFATGLLSPMPPTVSSTWFHVSERTTATALAALSNSVGAAVSFLVGPLSVSMPKMNGTHVLQNETNVHEISSELKDLHYSIFGVSVLLFIGCLVYFPDKPISAPSVSAATKRHGIKEGALVLIRNPNVWLLSIISALPLGFFGNWGSILDVILSPLGISQTEAGWMNFYASIAGVFAGICISRFADVFKRKMKLIIIVLYLIAGGGFAWFSCMAVHFITPTKASMYGAVILVNVVISCTGPLFMEILCETTYPVAEGITVGFMGTIINFGAFVFLLIDQAARIDIGWTNWVITGVYVVAGFMMFFFREQYKRVDVDIQVDGSSAYRIFE